MPNRLASEKSPYLLQHADNPVDWYPWGEEAFRRAREADLPLLLSIGYSACHWCHVMAHESFENPTVASLMNDNFVNVKVDREERPDVDSVYMEAVQMMTGQGGWPLNVFLTADLKPFFGGTYWPPAPRHGMPSWPQLLQSIILAWRNERRRVEASAASLIEQLGAMAKITSSLDSLDASILDSAFQTMASHFDETHGGFGGAPKFPQPMNLELLLRTYHRTGDHEALRMVAWTLDRMADGGIHDQLGGGFHRYSVDEAWAIPHFEKMLYDNAMLSLLYVHAWQASGNPRFREVARSTLEYVLREMTSPEGGFYSSQDADSEGEEGRFYVWTAREVDEILPRQDAEIFKARYGVSESGAFDGRTVLAIRATEDEVASGLGLDRRQVRDSLESGRGALLEARERRLRPACDDKILTDWNALMLRAFALAGRAFGRSDFLDAARKNAAFLLERLLPDGHLLHVYREGQAGVEGYLDDHAFLVEGLTTLFEVTGEAHWLRVSVEIAGAMLEKFRDPDRGGFFDSLDGGAVPVRPKTILDGVVPSGNASAAMGLLRLARLTGRSDLEDVAREILSMVAPAASAHALSFAYMLSALDFYLAGNREIAIIGRAAGSDTLDLLTTVYARYLPNTVKVLWDPALTIPEEMSIPLLEGRGLVEGRAAAYICADYACRRPVTSGAQVALELSEAA